MTKTNFKLLQSYSQFKNDLIDKVFFEIVHTADNKYVKDQLMYSDFTCNSVFSSFFSRVSMNFSTCAIVYSKSEIYFN